MKKYPASAMPAPNTEYPRYLNPARRAAEVPLCSTIGTVMRDIISKNMYMVTKLAAMASPASTPSVMV